MHKRMGKQGMFTLSSALLTLLLIIYGCTASDGDGGGPRGYYTISGTIFAEAGNRMDSDVNDTSGPIPSDNNSFANAQPFSGAPIGISGYVNRRYAGEEGNSYSTGDQSDIFFIQGLNGDETVRLSLADDAEAEVDLILWDSSDSPVQLDIMEGITRTGSLSVPAAGSYYVEVSVQTGAATYRLIIADAWSATQSTGTPSKAEFVPGEILVKLRSTGSDRQAKACFAAAKGLRMTDYGAGSWVRLLVDDVDTAFNALNIKRTARQFDSSFTTLDRRKQETLAVIKALRQNSDVVYAEPNYIRRPFFTPDDTYVTRQWHIDMISLPQAWDTTTGSADTIVAVIDTGVLLAHPDLANKCIAGYDFISDLSNARDGDGVDDNPNDTGDAASGSSSFHGTHVAGIIAAEFNNAIGVAGVGGDTSIMPVRVLGYEGGTTYDMVRAILWAAGVENPDDPDNIPLPPNPAHIINMSFGGYGFSHAEQDAVTEAVSAGVILVAAAGNEATDEPLYPAAYDGVVSVSAVGSDGFPAPYTNFGSTIDIAAPGGNIYTDVQPDGYVDGIFSTLGVGPNLDPDMTYGFYQGTSMASPVVAGVAALMKAVRTDLTVDEFDAYIASGSLSADATLFDHDNYYGYGLIDANQAVLAAASDPPTVLSISPRALFIGHGTTSGDLYVRKTGSDPLSLTSESVSTDVTWLEIVYTDLREDGFGSYRIDVDRRSAFRRHLYGNGNVYLKRHHCGGAGAGRGAA